MATCDVQALLDSAAGFSDLTEEQAATLRLRLLASIAGKSESDIQTLLANAAAFSDLTQQEFETLKLQMLCEWSTP